MSVEHRGTKALELWTRRATDGYPGVCINNMTTSWRDGLAFCALIHHFRPDLIDFKSLKAENILENNALAFRVAEQHIGIPALLDAEDMVQTEVPDRLSILTYVSQFYQAFSALGLIGPGGRRSPTSNNAKNTSSNATPPTSPTKAAPIVAPAKAKPISQPPATLQTKTETGFKTDKVMVGARTRREECVSCHKTVFLAERIVVGFPGQLRHRTCFRCDRCAAQLTLASYYETEKGQFCCETCPDEERQPVSFREEVAMEGKKSVNLKSEEKEGESTSDSESDSDSDSSDLDDDFPSNPLVTTPRTVFLRDSLGPDTAASSIIPPAKPPRSDTHSVSPTHNFSRISPALYGTSSQSSTPTETPSQSLSPSETDPISCDYAKGEDTSPPSLDLDTGQRTSERQLVNNDRSRFKPINKESEPKMSYATHETNRKPDKQQIQREHLEIEPKISELRKVFEDDSKATDKFVVTPSQNEDSEMFKLTHTLKDNKSGTEERDVPDAVNQDSYRANLSDKSVDSCNSNSVCNDAEVAAKISSVKMSNVNESVAAESNEKETSDNAPERFDEVNKSSLSSPPIHLDYNEVPEINIPSSVSTIKEEKKEGALELEDKDLPPSENREQSDCNIGDRKMQDVNDVKNVEIEVKVELMPEEVDLSEKTSSVIDSENVKEEKIDKSHKTEDNEEYPDELNPFGSDDEEKTVPVESNKHSVKDSQSDDTRGDSESGDTPLAKKVIKAPALNPFDDDDDDEEEEKISAEVNPNVKKRSLNPFWSDDDEQESDVSAASTPSKGKPKPPRPPPPTLRRDAVPITRKLILPAQPGDPLGPAPPSPSPSSKSSSSDQSTLRLKKKLRHAPAPPSGDSPHGGKGLAPRGPPSTLSGEDKAKDEALNVKMQKDLKNQTNKMRGDAYQKEKDLATVIKSGGISLPKCEVGEWRRKKGPAPSRPVPQKRAIRKLPMRQVQQELDDIEVKQTELERQGVLLETVIRERTERGSGSTSPDDTSLSTGSEADKSFSSITSSGSHPGMEVEDMILQLFELVNEKNELFRRQTELMYLKREKRLEEEYVELEYQIRCLMMRPTSEKNEDEVKREEELIGRLVKVVEQRDAVVNCLEMERQREAIEDESIATHMIKYQEKHIDGIDSEEEKEKIKKKKKMLGMLKKKKKGKEKEKMCKIDADKDVDETEIKKKKKKKWFKKPTTKEQIS